MDQLTRDGVTLFYQDVGKGAPPLLLVHGLGGDHTCLAPQLEHFRRHHRVVAVDLRGHGQSDKPRQDYTIAGYADDLVWLCYELGVYRPVVVGHGLGGMVALATAASHPDLPAGVVMLDSPILPPGGTITVRRSLSEEKRGVRDFWDALAQDGEPSSHSCNESTQQEALPSTQALSPEYVKESVQQQVAFWDGVAAVAACKLPLLYIDAGTPNADLSLLQSICPRLVIGRTVCTGHFLQLEAPEQVNAMIDRFLSVMVSQEVSAVWNA